MKIELNKKQKQFLIKNEYITVKTVDALNYATLTTYFVDNFDWILDTRLNNYNMNDLVLKAIDKTSLSIYDVMINFQGTDFDTLLNIK